MPKDNQELKKRFNKEMKWRYSGATVWQDGKLVMKNGVLVGVAGKKWWIAKCKKVWKTKSRHMDDFSLQPVAESYKFFKKHWGREKDIEEVIIEDEENEYF